MSLISRFTRRTTQATAVPTSIKRLSRHSRKSSLARIANRRFLVEQLERREVFDAGWAVSTPNTTIREIAGDAVGNHYIVGYHTNPASFGSITLPSSGTRDIVVAKQNANGSFIWAVKGGNPTANEDWTHDIAVDSAGNVYAVGDFTGTAQFGSYTLVSAGESDGFLAKLDGTTGEFLWVKQIGNDLEDSVRSVAVDSNDNVIIVSNLDGPQNPMSYVETAIISKLNGSGQVIWENTFSSNENVRMSSVEVDANDAIYALGVFNGTVNLPIGSFTSAVTNPSSFGRLQVDGLIVKLESSGDYTWARALQGDAPKVLNSLALGPNGALYVGGSFEGTINFDGNIKTSAGSADFFVAKLSDVTGIVEWVERFGGEGQDGTVVSVVVDSSGNLVATTATASDNTTVGSQPIAAIKHNTILLTFGPTGNLVEAYVSVGGYAPLAKGLHFDAAGNLYTAGGYAAPDGVNPAIAPQQKLSAAGGYIIKLPPRAPTKFFVVDESTVERTYNYSASGEVTVGQFFTDETPNSIIRGAASNATGSHLWLGEKSGYVLKYSTSGAYNGYWKTGSLGRTPSVEGVATNDTDVWIVDNATDKVYKYTGAASRTSGTQNAASSFKLNKSNTNPKGIVTDGTHIWIVNDSSTDKIFKYTMTGSLVGSWTIDSGNKSPTGLTIDPTNGSQNIWVVDNGTDKIYEYANARSRSSGSQASSATFALAVGNTNPQGIADPPPPSTQIAANEAVPSSDFSDVGGLPMNVIDAAKSKGIVATDSATNSPSKRAVQQHRLDVTSASSNTTQSRTTIESVPRGVAAKLSPTDTDDAIADFRPFSHDAQVDLV